MYVCLRMLISKSINMYLSHYLHKILSGLYPTVVSELIFFFSLQFGSHPIYRIALAAGGIDGISWKS